MNNLGELGHQVRYEFPGLPGRDLSVSSFRGMLIHRPNSIWASASMVCWAMNSYVGAIGTGGQYREVGLKWLNRALAAHRTVQAGPCIPATIFTN